MVRLDIKLAKIEDTENKDYLKLTFDINGKEVSGLYRKDELFVAMGKSELISAIAKRS